MKSLSVVFRLLAISSIPFWHAVCLLAIQNCCGPGDCIGLSSHAPSLQAQIRSCALGLAHINTMHVDNSWTCLALLTGAVMPMSNVDIVAVWSLLSREAKSFQKLACHGEESFNLHSECHLCLSCRQKCCWGKFPNTSYPVPK